MKCIILTVLACVIALEAKPQPLLGLGNIGLGLGSGISAGLGSGLGAGLGAGVGLGVGVVNLANGLVTGLVPGLVGGLGQGLNNGLGLGLGSGSSGAGFAQGGSGVTKVNAAAGSELNAGANCLGNHGSQKAGARNLQNASQNQNCLPSVPKAVSSDGNLAVNAGAKAGIDINPSNNHGPVGNGIGNGEHKI